MNKAIQATINKTRLVKRAEENQPHKCTNVYLAHHFSIKAVISLKYKLCELKHFPIAQMT